MSSQAEQRRAVLFDAVKKIKTRIAANTALVRDAPPWFQPGRPLSSYPPVQRKQAAQLLEAIGLLRLDRQTVADLSAELNALAHDPNRLRLCMDNVLEWLNAARTAADLVAAYQIDPAHRVDPRYRPPRDLDRIAGDILTLRAGQPGRRIRRLRDLTAIHGMTTAVLEDLVYTGCTQNVHPTLGVLLPVRLETRFYAPTTPGGSWKLRLRVIPDHASIDRHDPEATDFELDSVETMWQQAGGDLTTDKGKAAWQAFMGVQRPRRAAWLARTFPPLPPDGNGEIHIQRPAQARTDPRPNQLRGLPDQLEVWLARGGAPPQQVAILAVDPAAATLDLPLDLDDPTQRRWWNSYEIAVSLGLATEIDLGPAQPNNIDALYVVGLSDEDPQALFQAHRDAGQLALLELGAPTNTVDGEPAVDLGEDPDLWRRMVIEAPQNGAGTSQVSAALTGTPDAIGPLPGSQSAPRGLNQTLVSALWPSLWGHALKDVWGLGSGVHDVGLWAGDNLIPEGPLPPLRIGDVPYGLLPVTSLGQWKVHKGDPFVEEGMRTSLQRLRDAWEAAALSRGNVTNADTAKLLDLIAQSPNSEAYAWRFFLPLEMIFILMGAFDSPFSLLDVQHWWENLLAEILTYPVDPQGKFMTIGWPVDLHIPLVVPDNLPDGMEFKDALLMLIQIARENPGMIASGNFIKEFLRGVLPNSLLYRLLMFAVVVASAEVTRANQDRRRPIMEPIAVQANIATRFELDANAFQLLDPAQPESQIYERILDAIQVIAETDPEALERPFKAVLDTAIYRLDPWITAYPWRRLGALSGQKPRRQLGWYGWVDAPRPGQPGPTAGGLLHAPSPAQLYTAIILRDRALNDPEPARWQMNLDSQLIRLANRMAASVRLGAHIQEVLGREVERAVGDPVRIKALRKQFRLRTEHDGRRTCNGQAVLAADPASLGLTADQLTALEPLRQAIDVYGDLLVAEAVHHVVSGRAEVAGAAMDAAAGLSAPPNLEVIETPRTGRQLASTVVFCLPDVPAPAPTADASPTALADPAVAAWLLQRTGPANGPAWTWNVSVPGNAPTPVTLATLNLTPSDTASLSQGTLHQLALAAVPDAEEVLEDSPANAAHARVRQLIPLLGSRPAVPADLILGAGSDDTAVAAELRTRYTNLYAACGALIGGLGAAIGAAEPQQQAALHLALRWGIIPLAEHFPTLPEQVQAALDALNTRFNAAPLTADITELKADQLATAIVELATPEGRYAILGRVDFSTVPTLFTPDARPQPADLNPLDTAWLAVNAAVRQPMARLEVYQLEATLAGNAPPLFVWTNRPGDPWQLNTPLDPQTSRAPDTRLIVAYGPQGVLAAPTTLAVGLVDSWNETVPGTEQATSVGFGFNAPAARAPQAILLAVPPDVDKPLDGATLVSIVAETRQLAHARMATLSELVEYRGAVPTILLPAMGASAVDLT